MPVTITTVISKYIGTKVTKESPYQLAISPTPLTSASANQKPSQAIVVHAFNPSTTEAEAGGSM